MKGLPDLPPAIGKEFPLPAWYRAIQKVPLESLSIENIAKACRQQIHLDHVVPIALRRLQSDPLAGYMYDGELFASLKSVPQEHWREYKHDTVKLREIIKNIRTSKKIIDKDFAQDVEEVTHKIT
jgi:hypothetical protein